MLRYVFARIAFGLAFAALAAPSLLLRKPQSRTRLHIGARKPTWTGFS
jgi:hypothetical protein